MRAVQTTQGVSDIGRGVRSWSKAGGGRNERPGDVDGAAGADVRDVTIGLGDLESLDRLGQRYRRLPLAPPDRNHALKWGNLGEVR
jgi:hypothetical protein